MGSSEKTEYCAFTKAVEHLGDRWSLLIVRELALFGPQGFNTLATGLPGHVSRSVLTEKLRKLEEIGIVARDPSAPSRSAPYFLTPAGEQLMPTLKSLWAWAEHWIPEDPAAAQRDPTLVLWWLRHRIEATTLPERQIAIEFALPLDGSNRQWLLLAVGVEPELCQEDPLIGEDRYVFVEADAAALFPSPAASCPGPMRSPIARCVSSGIHASLPSSRVGSCLWHEMRMHRHVLRPESGSSPSAPPVERRPASDRAPGTAQRFRPAEELRRA